MKPKKEKKIMKLYAIFWRDAHTFGDWTDKKEMQEWAEKSYDEPNVSFGQLVEETKKYIVIASSLTKTKDLIGDITMIPKCLICKSVPVEIKIISPKK